MPGMSQSLMMTSAPSERNNSHASLPSAAVRHSWPRPSTAERSIMRVVRPSSTTSTFIALPISYRPGWAGALLLGDLGRQEGHSQQRAAQEEQQDVQHMDSAAPRAA